MLLFDKFENNNLKGSIVPGLSGRIKLSVNKGGCYKSVTGSACTSSNLVHFLRFRSADCELLTAIGAGACCGADCGKIGAIPSPATTKRSEPRSKDLTSSPQVYAPRRGKRSKYQKPRRSTPGGTTGGQNKNPFANRPAPSTGWNVCIPR